MSTRVISFFSQNFTVEISTPVEYSTKNRFLHLWEKAQKWHLTSKNAIFQRMWGLHVQYLRLWSKNVIDTFSNLQIINIGRLGRYIQNWKIAIFDPFYTEFQSEKIKSRKRLCLGAKNGQFATFYFFRLKFRVKSEPK